MITSFSRSGRREIASPRISRSSVSSSASAGRTLSGSSRVSRRDTWSPSPETDQSSSSAAIDDRAMSVSESSSSSTVIPTLLEISSSVGARPSFASSDVIARSISRARDRTERGTQSSARSSSMIEPRIRAIAYVSNLMSRSGS